MLYSIARSKQGAKEPQRILTGAADQKKFLAKCGQVAGHIKGSTARNRTIRKDFTKNKNRGCKKGCRTICTTLYVRE